MFTCLLPVVLRFLALSPAKHFEIAPSEKSKMQSYIFIMLFFSCNLFLCGEPVLPGPYDYHYETYENHLDICVLLSLL